MFHLKSSQEKEEKQEATIQAAQDPSSSTTAADARKAIVDESRKAGVAAYSFNPDATPEEKAARAGAVSELEQSPERN